MIIGILCFDCIKFFLLVMFDKGLWDFCVKILESINSNLYVKDYCFGGNFVFEFFIYGYGLFVYKIIMVGNILEGFSLGWIFGVVLFNLELLWKKYKGRIFYLIS